MAAKTTLSRCFLAWLSMLIAASGAWADEGSWVAVITQISDWVVISVHDDAEERDRPWIQEIRKAPKMVAEGDEVTVPEEGMSVELVCKSDRLLKLEGKTTWKASLEACAAGQEVRRGTYGLQKVEGGRLTSLGGYLFPQPSPRREVDDALHPMLLSPRLTALAMPRPTIQWTPAVGATSYQIELEGRRSFSQLVSAAEAGCAPAPSWGLEAACSWTLPAQLPGLMPGGVDTAITVSAITGDETVRSPYGTTSVRLLAPIERSRVESEIAALDLTPLSEAARLPLRLNIYARADLWASAIEVCQEALQQEESALVRITLADLYLLTGLDTLAERDYQGLLERSTDEIRAAAEEGLRRVAAARERDR